MSIIGDAVILGSGGGATASIFVKGVSQSDTVSCTKGSKSYTGNWVVKANPASHNLPSGYTELSYIQSSGTQYIATGFTPLIANSNRAEFGIKMSDISSGEYQALGSNANISLYTTASNKYFCCAGINTGIYDTGWHDIVINGSTSSRNINVDGISYTGGSKPSQVNEFWLFRLCTQSASDTYYGRYALSYCKLYENNVLKRNFVPCKNSSNVTGMYDLVNSQFYSSATSTAFTAGDEVPTYFYGREFTGINEYGTYTIASSGYTSESVIVDMATDYEIEMEAA